MRWDPLPLDELEPEPEVYCGGCRRLVPIVRYDSTSMEYLCASCREWGDDMIRQAVREAMEDL